MRFCRAENNLRNTASGMATTECFSQPRQYLGLSCVSTQDPEKHTLVKLGDAVADIRARGTDPLSPPTALASP